MRQTCNQCTAAFDITEDDRTFYKDISPIIGGTTFPIPPPTLCPECRRQRKLAWRNERTLYQRPCDLCKASTISVHSTENPYPVYCLSCWRSEQWDPLSSGRAYESGRSFFEQFHDLYQSTPQRAVVSEEGLTCENCAYCFDISYSKNCYLVFGTWKIENSLYCNISDQSKYCMDCYGVKLGSELVYDSLDSQRLYNCIALQNSDNCTDCAFGFDLKGCKNCTGCVSLRQKEFCIWNEQYDEATYRAKVLEFCLSSYAGYRSMADQFAAFSLTFPRRALNLQNCEDCAGDHLFNCRNVLGFVSSNSEHSKWIERSDAPVHSYDIVQSGNCQWSLEQITGDNTYGVHFSMYCNHSKQLLYCSDCLACEHCIGCVSLRNKRYCILNTQYTKEEYEVLASEILCAMTGQKEFGEFLPIAMSPFGYNETNAGEFYPLTKEGVEGRGWRWRVTSASTTGKETIASNAIPGDIADVKDAILSEVLACTSCQKNYRLVQQELDLYRTMHIPVPRWCPNCRWKDRMRRRTAFSLFDRACNQCGKPIVTSYQPSRPEIVICEECYLKTVY